MLTVYLIFTGTCKEAMEFYADCLGGKITIMRTFEESPLAVTEETKDLIFDSEIKAKDIIIKASDALPENKIIEGSNFSLFLTCKAKEELQDKYSKLSKEGKVIMPLEEAGKIKSFGMFKDKFGIQWMITLQDNSS